jgi:hypothetical protein
MFASSRAFRRLGDRYLGAEAGCGYRYGWGTITRIGLSVSLSFIHSLITVPISPRIHSGVYTFVLDASFCGAFNSNIHFTHLSFFLWLPRKVLQYTIKSLQVARVKAQAQVKQHNQCYAPTSARLTYVQILPSSTSVPGSIVRNVARGASQLLIIRLG